MSLAALAAAGAYFLYGKEGVKNRTKIKGWTLKMKGEVLDGLEKAQKRINRAQYDRLVDQVTKKYRKVKKVSKPELSKLNKDLKSAWSKISRELVA